MRTSRVMKTWVVPGEEINAEFAEGAEDTEEGLKWDAVERVPPGIEEAGSFSSIQATVRSCLRAKSMPRNNSLE